MNSKRVVVFLHGVGNSGATWDEVIDSMPRTVRAISVDLLGFGASPKPKKMKYNISIQARSLMVTLFFKGIRRKVTLVGHSMGSLVAIEFARKYPFAVDKLILCSPPLYDDHERDEIIPSQTTILKRLYKSIIRDPKVFLSAVPLASKLRIVGDAFDVTNKNIDIYTAALESSILHQSSYKDIFKLKTPTAIVHGLLDPLVIRKNLDRVVDVNKNVKLVVVAAGHELIGTYIPAVEKIINE